MVETSTFSLKYKVKVDDIDIDQLMNYHLLISLSEKGMSVSVIDTISKRCLLGEKYSFNSHEEEQIMDTVSNIIEDHHLLNARFWNKVTVSYSSPKFTLVPHDLVDKDNLTKYLELNSHVDSKNESVLGYHHKDLGLYDIFSIPKAITKLFSELYDDKVSFTHQTSSLISGVVNAQDTKSEKSIYINCEEEVITILVLKSGQLEYCNQFMISNNHDIAYYTLFVMNELYLNPESTSLTIWGELDVKSDAFLQLFKYIRNVKFGSRPKQLTFSYNFDAIEEHQLFSTLSTYYCG